MLRSKPLALPAAAAAALLLVTVAAGADGPVVTATRTLAGLDDGAAGGFEPPDVSIAAGRGFVVEFVNVAARAWTTTGDPPQLAQTRDLASLFGSGKDRLTDPRVVFDSASGRFFASISDVDRGAVLLAVSTSGDPTAAWTVSSYAASGCADQPRLGISDDVVVLAADVFEGCNEGGAATLGAELWTVNKAELVAGSTAPAVSTFGPTSAYASLAPAQSLSSTATEYVVSVDKRSSRVVHLLTVDGVPPAVVTVAEAAAPAITSLLRPPPAAQPPATGLRPAISTNDNRVLDSVWENGRLWFSANARCTPPGDALLRSCGRVAELDTAAQTVTWQTDLALAGGHVFYPAIRPDAAGNLVVVAGESGLAVLPRLVVFARTADGALTAPAVVAKSADAYRGDRYGDYFGAARDPVDGGVVWVGGEAGTDVPGGSGWTTAVASVVVTPAGGTPPAAAALPPPGVRALVAAPRRAGSVALAYRALDDGDAVRTIVTVRNTKNAVVYRKTTATGPLRAEQRYVVLWPVRKARGSFRFCVHTESPSGQESPESCVAITVR